MMIEVKKSPEQIAAGCLLVLLMAVTTTAFLFNNPGKMLSNIADAVLNRPDPATPRALPSDLCVIDGKPLMPELDYICYGSSPGLVLKYINTNGDLVLLGEKQILGVYEGDFCDG
jgi:hypothetical protein